MDNEKQKKTKKLSGFYIALCCCVLAIGLVGYLTEKQTHKATTVVSTDISQLSDSDTFSSDITAPNTETKNTDGANNETEANVSLEDAKEVISTVVTEDTADNENNEEDENTEISNEDTEETVTAADEEPAEKVFYNPEAAGYTDDNPDTDNTAITVSAEQPVFIAPVDGEIVERYSEQLVFNTSLDDWRTHDGIDIAAQKGCAVEAAARGVVDAIYENEMGKCVDLSHSGGFVTRYMGLDTVENLTEGKEVSSGEVIGTIGSCKGENITGPHLHFEMEKNKQTVDPTGYLP